jgi:hypothetical protein
MSRKGDDKFPGLINLTCLFTIFCCANNDTLQSTRGRETAMLSCTAYNRTVESELMEIRFTNVNYVPHGFTVS